MKSGRTHILRFLACPLIIAGMLCLLCSCTSVREANGTPSPTEAAAPTEAVPYGEDPIISEVASNPVATGTPTSEPSPEARITEPGTEDPGGFEIPIDETYFADPEFRRFIEVNLDTDKNCLLSEAEINAVTEMTLHAQVSDLEGIAFFGELVSLTCNDTSLQYLDVSRNAHLKYLNCSGNRLSELYLGDNSPLEHLDCSSNQLNTLDISGCPELQILNCDNNQISRLSIRDNTRLKELHCACNDLPLLNLTPLIGLKILDCSENRLEELDLSTCSLTELHCTDNSLVELDLRTHSSLRILECRANYNLQNLRTDNNPLLEYLDCSVCGLSGPLKLEANPLLTVLYCSGNELTRLSGLSSCTKLTQLDCSTNHLTTLGLSGMNDLKIIYCSYNDLSSLVIAPNTEKLYCRSNELEELALAPTLTYLDCGDNKFMRFSPQGAPLLQVLRCDGNTFTSLDVRGLGALEELYCGNGNLTSLDLSGHSRLHSLDCSHSHLSSLNLSGCTSLRYINCSINGLSKLDLSGLINLVSLDCANNRLTELNLSDTRELMYLLCEKNQLTSLNVRNCYRLTAASILSDAGLTVRLFTVRFDREKYAANNRSNLQARADRYKKDLSGQYESGVIRTAGLIETIRSNDRTMVEIYESAVYGRIQTEDGENELYDYSVFARVVSNGKYLVSDRIFTTTEPLTGDQRRYRRFPGLITNELLWGYDDTSEDPWTYDDLNEGSSIIFDAFYRLVEANLSAATVIGEPGDWYWYCTDPAEFYVYDTFRFWNLPDADTGCLGRSSLIARDAEQSTSLTVSVDTYLFGNFASTPDLVTHGLNENYSSGSTADDLLALSYCKSVGVPGAVESLALDVDLRWRINGRYADEMQVASPDGTVKQTRTFASGMVLTITYAPENYWELAHIFFVEALVEVSGTRYRPIATNFSSY